MQDNTKQTQKVNMTSHMAKRTAKNSVFLDLFQNKRYLLKLYKTLHPEDEAATEDSLTDVTITNVLTDNLYNDPCGSTVYMDSEHSGKNFAVPGA